MPTESAVSIADLRAQFEDRVIAPGDARYDQARALFYANFDRRPEVIVRAADATEVARVVTLARETGTALAVRGGGHGVAGHSVADGGITLDLSNLRGLDIDVERRTAWAQAGLTAGEYTAAAGAHGLATGFGDTGSVGIGGLTLGGGVGFLVRKHGLTIDHLLAAEVVTADGKLVRADAETHPDLFWAIRGGGGNFGVATRFQFRLHEVSTIVGGILILPATPQTVADFVAEADAAPEELSTIANVMPAPPMPFIPAEHHGEMIIMGLMCWAGDVDAGQQVMQRFRAIATPVVDLVEPGTYGGLFEGAEEEYRPTAVGTNVFLDGVDTDLAAAILDRLRAGTASLRVAQLRALGGAAARVPASATAYAHRASRVMVNLGAFYDGPDDRVVQQAWVDDFAAAIRLPDSGAYVNFLGDEPARLREAYPGGTWERLSRIKTRYDPTNFFRLNHNIPPLDPAR